VATDLTIASPISRACALPRTAIGTLIFGGAVGLILFFLILPTLIVIPMSLGTSTYIEFPPRGVTLRWYLDYLRDPDWMAATFFSLRIALATTASATVVGTLASIALVRGNLPGKSVIQALTLSPMVVPHIVIAIAVYLFFAPLRLTGTFLGFLVAHTMLSVPYVVITVTAALQRFDPALERAVTAGEPAHMARYAFQLAQDFSRFYEKFNVLDEPDVERRNFLLWMTQFFADQLEQSLAILGIAVPAYM